MYRKTKFPLVLFMIITLFISLLPMSALSENTIASSITDPIRHDKNKWLLLPEWSSGAIVDGQLNEGAWQEAAVLDGFRTTFHEHTLPYPVEYKMAYDSQNLYIGGEIPYEEANSLAKVELVIRSENNGDTHHVVEIPVNPTPSPNLNTFWNLSKDRANYFVNLGRQDITDAAYETTDNGGNVTVEASIPLNSIVPSGVTAGDEWQVNIMHVHNLNTKPLTSWIPVRNSDQWDRGEGLEETVNFFASVVNQGRMGSVFFGQVPGELLQQHTGSLQAVPWEPEQTELSFLGFTQKELTFTPPAGSTSPMDAALHWKEPGGAWTPLTHQGLTEGGATASVTFEHPEPYLDGTYQLLLTVASGAQSDVSVSVLTIDRESMIAAGLSAYDFSPDPNDPRTAVQWSEPSAQVTAIMDNIPPQPGFNYVGLPEQPELYPENLYSLSADGNSLIAKATGTVYPNAQYSEDQTQVFTNGKGESVSVPYYEDAAGKKYFITAHLWYLQRMKAMDDISALASSDPLGAARLLYAFAQAYEGYVPTNDSPWHTQFLNNGSEPPNPYWGGVWHRWWWLDLDRLNRLMSAYSKVKTTDAFQQLSAEVGEDVEQKLIEEMFKPSVEFTLSYHIRQGNMVTRHWMGLIQAAQAINEPDYIHSVVEQIEDFATSMFLSDGFWSEVTTSYHAQTINGLNQALDMLHGWSDPPGYISPRTGTRFDNLDMVATLPIIGKALALNNKLVYPNGKHYPIQDTWASGVSNQPDLDVGSMLLPAARISRLTSGSGTDQSQVYMNFQPKYGHVHLDGINLSLYAEGQELLPDLGYTHNTQYGWFTRSTFGHNTVVVDGQDMSLTDTSIHGGNIESFVPEGGGFQMMRASYEAAYAAASEYNREPWFIPFSGDTGEKGYVLDLFRVDGGSRHEYTLQGDANRDAYFHSPANVTEYGPYLLPAGTEVVEPVDNFDSGSAEGHYPGYLYLRDVQQAELTGDQYSLTLTTEENNTQQSRMKLTGLLEPGATNELYLGRSPSLRSIRLNGKSMDTNEEANKYTMPKMVLRREGQDLRSTFVTLMEPFQGQDEPRIEVVVRLQKDQGPEDAVAVSVTYGGTTDILLSNPNYEQQALVIGDITLEGKAGMIRMQNGVVREMTLVGGTLLKKGSLEVVGNVYTGTIDHTLRLVEGDTYDGLVTSNSVAVTADVIGSYVIVKHPDGSTSGFEIGDVVQENNETILVLAEHDPGFVIHADGSSKQTYYPAKQWQGTHEFTIVQRVHAQGLESPDPTSGADGIVNGVVYTPEGSLLAGAAVNLTGYSTISDVSGSDGSFALSGVPVGNQRVTVKHEPYTQTLSDIVDMAAGQTISVAITMKEEFPQLPDVPLISTVSGAGIGDSLPVRSSSNGTIYLVPDGTAVDKTSIQAASVSTATVNADEQIFLATEGLTQGKYMVYAMNELDVISAGFQVVLIEKNTEWMDDTDQLLTYSGNWTNAESSSYYGGTQKLGRSTGAYVDIPFYGTKANVLSTISRSRGMANIYVDGVFQSTVDTYSYNTLYQQVIYDTGLLEEGFHMIRVEVVGETNPDALQIWVSLDALQVIPLLPSVSSVSGVGIGDNLPVVSSVDGTIYLVPEGTEASKSSIETASVTMNESIANEQSLLDTEGLSEGKYMLYVISEQDIISVGVQVVLIEKNTEWLDDTNPILTYSGNWTNAASSAYYGGTQKLGRSNSAYVDIPIYGTRANVLSTISRSRGMANIYVDGVFQSTMDTYSYNTLYQQVIYDTGLLEEGFHMIRVEVAGEMNPDATQIWVSLDALQVIPLPLTVNTVSGVGIGDSLPTVSSVDGTIYLVPEGTEASKSSIETASVTMNESIADEQSLLDTEGLSEGKYMLYVISEQDIISAGVQVVLIEKNTEWLDDTNPILTYSGDWTDSESSAYYGGTQKLGRSTSAYVDIPFYGTQANVLSTVSRSRGMANIYVDGLLQTKVDTYSYSTLYQQIIYDTGLLEEGFHMIRIEVAGEKSSDAQQEWVAFDSLMFIPPPPIQLQITLHPGKLNKSSNGGANSLTVEIAFEEIADVSLLNVSTITMEVNGESIPAQLNPTSVDGNVTMVKFDRQLVIQALGDLSGEIEVSVKGKTNEGKSFAGSAHVLVKD